MGVHQQGHLSPRRLGRGRDHLGGRLGPADVLRLYRARWQVELVFKRMKQLLRFNQLRSTNRTTVEATVRALLVAWALQEDMGQKSRHV